MNVDEVKRAEALEQDVYPHWEPALKGFPGGENPLRRHRRSRRRALRGSYPLAKTMSSSSAPWA
jgi:hypothetical protein